MESKRSRATGSVYKIRNNRSALHLKQCVANEMEETNRSRTEARSVLQGGSPEEMHTDLDGQENILRQNMDTEETRTIASPMLQPIISSVSNGHEDILSDDQDYSEQDESFEQISDDLSFREKLRSWALSTNQTHHALNSLLEILRKKTDFPLPKDARTLMRTPTNTAACISTIEGGRFWYHGISNCLQEYFRFRIRDATDAAVSRQFEPF